jgi:hypothetical protein
MIKFTIPQPKQPMLKVVKVGSLPIGTFFQVVDTNKSEIPLSEFGHLSTFSVAGLVIQGAGNSKVSHLRFSNKGNELNDTYADLSVSNCVVLDFNLELTPRIS